MSAVCPVLELVSCMLRIVWGDVGDGQRREARKKALMKSSPSGNKAVYMGPDTRHKQPLPSEVFIS